MNNRRKLVIALGAIVLVSVLGPTIAKEPDVVPKKFRVFMGGIPNPTYQIELEGVALRYSRGSMYRYDPHNANTTAMAGVPSDR